MTVQLGNEQRCEKLSPLDKLEVQGEGKEVECESTLDHYERCDVFV